MELLQCQTLRQNSLWISTRVHLGSKQQGGVSIKPPAHRHPMLEGTKLERQRPWAGPSMLYWFPHWENGLVDSVRTCEMRGQDLTYDFTRMSLEGSIPSATEPGKEGGGPLRLELGSCVSWEGFLHGPWGVGFRGVVKCNYWAFVAPIRATCGSRSDVS